MESVARIPTFVKGWLPKLAVLVCAGARLHAQMMSPNGISTAQNIGVEEQAGIDEDIARHLGDVPKNPGLRAKLSPSPNPAAVHAATRKVADWELARAVPYLDRNWMWSVRQIESR
jgi:hypothetical protein